MTTKIEITNCQDCKSYNSSVFCNLDNDLLTNLNRNKSVFLFKKGQHVFTEGGRPLGAYCIIKGRVKIDKFGLNKDQIVRIGSRSDLIGYRALIANEVYSATAEALEDTEVCFIPKSSFLYFINKDKEFSLELMRILSQDVKNAERNSMNIAQRTVMERLAEYLILMHEKLSKDANAQDVFSYSRKDLSDIIGCAPETLIRSLSALKNDEIISIVKKDIKVVDIQRLHR
ncbi:MAG TPA: Crp/Fnr family transcriptional regulator, partial [Flavobacteriales bacterium]|nr:Crp/Fnr family transcriptional regulator [Flavobacteriales bacterium]